MLTEADYAKKQMVFVFFNKGEKMSFGNDNLIVKDEAGKIKFQCSCYRLFLVYAIGHSTFTSVLIQKARRFGFRIAFYTPGFRLYAIIGAEKDGNVLLKKKQYAYSGIEIGRLLVRNKISAQYRTLAMERNKGALLREDKAKIASCYEEAAQAQNINSLMAYEGMSAKLYFRNEFDNIAWTGRRPRVKDDVANSVLDIGYTLLFAFVEAIVSAFGFDLFCGVLHRQFYMRKSLVCDFVEPFRPLIDHAVRKAFNLRQIKENDFDVINRQYQLKWEKNSEYVSFLMEPIIEKREEIFRYIEYYYRCFMKDRDIADYPYYWGGVVQIGSHKL